MNHPHLKPGIYTHYKGAQYEVIDVATHSETEERFVVYRPMYGERALWIRPLEMFVETVEYMGETVPRFKFAHDSQES